MVNLDELERLHNAATPVPWERLERYTDGADWLLGNAGHDLLIVDDDGAAAVNTRRDARLIVAMRNALPELIRLARLGLEAECGGG